MKRVGSTLGTFLIYTYASLIISLFCKLILHIQLNSSNLEHLYWVNIILDIVFIVSSIALNFNVLLKNEFDGKSVINKILIFIARLIIIFIIFMVIKIIVAIILSFIAALFHLSSESNNQWLIEQIINKHPIGMFASVCLFAPFMEELIFRGSVRKVITNDWLFIFTSGLLFGLVHVLHHQSVVIILLVCAIFINIILMSKKMDALKKLLASIGVCFATIIIMAITLQFSSGNLINLIMNIDMSEAVNSLSYITMGLCLAYVYKKFNNIYLCMGIHACNNIFGYVMIIFTMLLK